ncbi:WD repeat-containing protein 93-like [Haliotis rubra]|uniref:WD repeat-containing protein 93-like n=1 Tax=Haliotis rubra TaxID=36100 RepID=UPI001EE5B10D|nr:WD repeat-containing protein 93-like [Haliotis rubra]
MPVYLRKNVVYTPPSIENVSDEDEDDYIQDPEQIRDILPQPYRMINKLINGILDVVWEDVSQKESARIAEQSKIRPPKYDCGVEIQNQTHCKATSLADSGDGRYIFIGLPNGLSVMDASTQKPITIWEEDNMEIVNIRSHVMGVQTYLIVTLDDMGTGRLFAFAFDCLFMLKVLNEQESGAKHLVSKCESSNEGDYAGVVLENTSTKETWLEIHKLPRDAWLRELEAIQAQIAPKQNPQEETSGEAQNTEGHGTEGESTQLIKQIHEKSRSSSASSGKSSSSDRQRKKNRSDSKKGRGKDRSGSPKPSTPPPMTGNPGDKMSYKFTAPTLVLKVKPPTPLTANTSSSTYSACQKIDSGEVIGTGQSHLLSANHLEGRDTMFNHLHENLLKYLPKDKTEEEIVVAPTFHFLNAGRMVPQGLEQPSQAGLPTTVAVWWTGGSHVTHYSLLKTAKDFEHKPDVVWPFSCRIRCSSVSSCTVLLAVGLENGTVVLWNRYLGIDKGVIRICQDVPIERLKFLDPSITQPASQGYPPYRKKRHLSADPEPEWGRVHLQHRGWPTDNTYLSDTSIFSFTCYFPFHSRPDKQEEKETILDTMPDVPELLLVAQQNGSLLLKDVTTGSNLCQMTLPSTHQLTNPWEPVLAFGSGGQLLYVKGTKIPAEDESEVEEETEIEESPPEASKSSLFMFQLRSFPSLDPYWKREREVVSYLVHTTLEQRLEVLMKERLAQQALRKTRMQMRWGMLRQELDLIQQSRDVAKRRALSRVPLSASTYKSSASILLL